MEEIKTVLTDAVVKIRGGGTPHPPILLSTVYTGSCYMY